MVTTSVSYTLGARLDENPLRKRFVTHPFFCELADKRLSKRQAAIIVGQWWHALHYFPTFLARCVAVLPSIESKSAIARILNQEAGGGNARQAHEVIYIHTMEGAGFSREQIADSPPFQETAALVAGYEGAGMHVNSALGFIFATEVTDLLMVSSIGKVISQATGVQELEWVDIHVSQEPDHVEEANHSLMGGFSMADESLIIESAEEMWSLWIGFFDRLYYEITKAANVELRNRATLAV